MSRIAPRVLRYFARVSTFFAASGVDRAPDDQAAVGRIRAAMLEAMPGGNDSRSVHLRQRLASAKDLQHLWFMRCDLMTVLSASRGEAAAQRALSRLSAMFDGVLPQTMMPRPSRLHQRTVRHLR